MKQLCYLGILKGFSAYSSPVMIISWKVTQDKKSSYRFYTFQCKNS